MLPMGMMGQSSSSSSSSTPSDRAADQGPVARPRAAQVEKGGAAVTLETSEPLFQLIAGLNACGYDADLDKSAPVRAKIRAEMNEALAGSEEARASRDALCNYVRLHHQGDTGLDVGQYVSLALYLSPPPELTPNVSELDLPPQASGVVNVLPLLRTFAEAVDLHLIWLRHRAEYEALTARVHEPMVQMILATNIYLHQPVSSYDGRRFLVLLEPMLSPNLTNARIYGTDYIIVTSPDNTPAPGSGATLADLQATDPVRLAEIRHIYLHYVVEPMVYSRGSAMERIQPVLRGVQDAPLEFFYKSDAVALLTECLIKAIEARTFVIAAAAPKKPGGIRSRAEMDQYDAEKLAYEKQTALEQIRLVGTDERQGWVLTSYFYDQLGVMSKTGDGLRDEIAQMIYGMDVDGERKRAETIQFVKDVPPDPLRPAYKPRKIEGLDLAEVDLMKGDSNGAADLAEAALADPAGDHGRARYMLARIDLMAGDPEAAMKGFEETLTLSKDPRTLAWAHIYMGRLYDSENPPEREKAVAEYKTALEVRDSKPDTKLAAEAGVKKPFALPARAKQVEDDDKDFDPTGKKEKEAYKPDAPKEKE